MCLSSASCPNWVPRPMASCVRPPAVPESPRPPDARGHRLGGSQPHLQRPGHVPLPVSTLGGLLRRRNRPHAHRPGRTSTPRASGGSRLPLPPPAPPGRCHTSTPLPGTKILSSFLGLHRPGAETNWPQQRTQILSQRAASHRGSGARPSRGPSAGRADAGPSPSPLSVCGSSPPVLTRTQPCGIMATLGASA